MAGVLNAMRKSKGYGQRKGYKKSPYSENVSLIITSPSTTQ